MDKKGFFFVSDVHLGLDLKDASAREARFVSFLRSDSVRNAKAVYLLGDIWDFWYEYKYVVPKEGVRVVAALIDLMDGGTEVFFMPGNHDIWCYHFFEELGIHKIEQPYFTEIDGKRFCLGHGDGLGGSSFGLTVMRAIFHNKFLQALFSTLHPRLAFTFGNRWSHSNRRSHKPYEFKGKDERIYKYATSVAASRHVDYFVFGHLHTAQRMEIPGGGEMFLLGDWMEKNSYLYFSGIGVDGGSSMKME